MSVSRSATPSATSADSTRRCSDRLGVANRALVKQRCIGGSSPAVMVDLTDLTFLDCGGYGALIASRSELERHYRTLTLVGAVGEPRRLLELIDQLELSGPPL